MWILGVGCAFGVLASACVAQQADVVRIKRELDGKIRQLNASRAELQQAVANANEALQEANAIIAQQRGEIRELLHARAELMDQLTTLKDGDLSEVHGELEQHAHHVRVLAGRLKRTMEEVQASREIVQQHVEAMAPLVNEVQARLSRQEDVLAAQRAKDEEFREALVRFQSALTGLREVQQQQDARVTAMNEQLEAMAERQTRESQRVTKALEAIEGSMQTMVSAMENVSRTLTDRIEEQDRKMTALSTRLEGEVAARTDFDHQRRRLGQVSDSVDRLHRVVREAMNRIGERVDAHEEELARLRNNRPAVPVSVPTRSSVETSPVSGSSGKREGAAAPHTSGPSVAERSTQAAMWAEYRQHHAELRKGNFMEALHGFSRFLERYPDSPLAANAQYWLGECYYGQRQFRQAIAEFERVFTLYPNSDKVPAALLKIGYSHLELKDATTAKAVFRQLVRIFPDSPEAAKAYARMAEGDAHPEGAS